MDARRGCESPLWNLPGPGFKSQRLHHARTRLTVMLCPAGSHQDTVIGSILHKFYIGRRGRAHKSFVDNYLRRNVLFINRDLTCIPARMWYNVRMKNEKTPLLVCCSCSCTSEEVQIFDHPDGVSDLDMCLECADDLCDFQEYQRENENSLASFPKIW